MKRFKILGAIISILLCLSVANTAFGVTLGVSLTYQQQTNWCWDASSKMVLDYYGYNYSLCYINAWAINSPDCTTGNCYTETCNVQNDMFSDYNSNYGIRSILYYVSGVLYSTPHYSELSENAVQTEIYGGRPFIMRWLWYGGNGHFLVVYAYDGTYVYLHDPWYGDSYGYYDDVVGCDECDHKWTHTLTLDYTSPAYTDIGHNYGGGVNNTVEFVGCESGQAMHGIATCYGDWWTDPCSWTSYCSTGWQYNPSDFYYTGDNCSFCQ